MTELPSLSVSCPPPQITKVSEIEVQFLRRKISEIRETPNLRIALSHSHRHDFPLQPCCQMEFDTCDSAVNPGRDLNDCLPLSLFPRYHFQSPSPNLAPSPSSGAGRRESLTSAFSSVLKIGFKYSAD